MGKESTIQWTDITWNIARGCSKVDEDCKFCYMYRDSLNGTRYDPKDIVRTKTVFNLPLKVKEPSRIFTCSLTDFFHEAIDSYRDEAWDIMRKCPQHTFQILTKRPERILDHLPDDFNENFRHVQLGTSVGSQAGIERLQTLCELKLILGLKNVFFASLEPLHAPVDLNTKFYAYEHSIINFLDWVIVGGESGNDNGKYRFRPCHLRWIQDIVDVCKANNVPVFVKQMGTRLSKYLKMDDRHGSNINQFPESMQFREFPTKK